MRRLSQNRLKAARRSNALDKTVLMIGTSILLLQNSFVAANNLPTTTTTTTTTTILRQARTSSTTKSSSQIHAHETNSISSAFVSPFSTSSSCSKQCTVKSNCEQESFLTLTDTFPTILQKQGTSTLLNFRRKSVKSATSCHPYRRTKQQVFSRNGSNDIWEDVDIDIMTVATTTTTTTTTLPKEQRKQQLKKNNERGSWRLRGIFARNKRTGRDERSASQHGVIETMGVVGEIERKDPSVPGKALHYMATATTTDQSTIGLDFIGKEGETKDKGESSSNDTTLVQQQDANNPDGEKNSTITEQSPSLSTQKKLLSKKRKKAVPMLARFSRRIFQRTVHLLLCRWSVYPPHNLHVVSNPRGNVLTRLLARGEIKSDVRIDFDRLVFHNIRMSGGRIDIRGMGLKVLANVPTPIGRRMRSGGFLGMKKMKRFSSPFEFHAQNCTFTQDDILSSSCIRNGLQNLLNNILNKSGFLSATSVTVSSVKILPTKKISCVGKATTALGAQVPFEVRTGLSVSSRGHVLLFPGLEISLNTAFPFQVFVPVVPEVDVDLGHNAQIENLVINGKRRKMSLSARATVTPKNENRLNYSQQKSSYLAQYSCDVGKWVTRIGNFNK